MVCLCMYISVCAFLPRSDRDQARAKYNECSVSNGRDHYKELPWPCVMIAPNLWFK